MIENSISLVKKIVLERVPLDKYAVFLFGSRVLGNNHSLSDIDVGILGDQRLPAMQLVDIEETLEASDVILKVDVIDFSVVGSEFKKEALSNIEIWNCPKNIRLT